MDEGYGTIAKEEGGGERGRGGGFGVSYSLTKGVPFRVIKAWARYLKEGGARCKVAEAGGMERDGRSIS